MRRTARPQEVATWLDQAWFHALAEVLAKPPSPYDIHDPLAPLFRMATRVRSGGSLSADLDAIAAGLAALGEVAGLPLPARITIREKPPEPRQGHRRRRALPLPPTIVLRRFGRSIWFWGEVLGYRPAN